jgi:hypothetical protein
MMKGVVEADSNIRAWPTTFVSVPRVGERILSIDHKEVGEVIWVTHCEKMITERVSVGHGGCGESAYKEPYIMIKVNSRSV